MVNFNKIILYLIFVSLVSLTLFSSKGYCDDWVSIGKNDDYLYSYNKTNLNINRKTNKIKVWTKFIYTEKGKESIINNRKDKGLTITNYNALSYSFNLYLYDYNKIKYRMLSSDDYTMSGDTLSSFNNSGLEWDNIIPDSIFDMILIKILKDYKIKR